MVKTDDLRGAWRLHYIEREIRKVIASAQPTFIALEGYAMAFGDKNGKRKQRPFDTGELGGVLRLLFWREGVPVMIVPPKTLKMVIAGSGKAKKEQMVEAVEALHSCSGKSFDEADALGLMTVAETRMGLHAIGLSPSKLASVNACEILPGQLKSFANPFLSGGSEALRTP